VEKIAESVLLVSAVVVGLIIVGLLLGFPIMWLWNWLMPTIFELPTIDFWQALGLWALSLALFSHGNYSKRKD